MERKIRYYNPICFGLDAFENTEELIGLLDKEFRTELENIMERGIALIKEKGVAKSE